MKLFQTIYASFFRICVCFSRYQDPLFLESAARNELTAEHKGEEWNFTGSSYGYFLKWWYPQNTPKWSILVGKPKLLGTTILGNPNIHIIGLPALSTLADGLGIHHVQNWTYSCLMTPLLQIHWRWNLRKSSAFFVLRHVWHGRYIVLVGGWTKPICKNMFVKLDHLSQGWKFKKNL